MEHWFDSLSRPHTRRTTLKAAAVAGAALVLPALRTPRASATDKEPCYTACAAAAAKQWNDTDNLVCKPIGVESALSFLNLISHPDLLAMVSRGLPLANCMASAELHWHRDMLACRDPDCGDSAKYPGGKVKKPAPKCTPIEEKRCGDICCYVTTDCCLKNGEYVCYAAGHDCGADTAGG